MPTEDQRERDQMWKRIDSHGQRLNDLERGVTEVKGQTDEHGRNIGELSAAVQRAEASTNQVHLDMNTLIGQGQAMRRIVLWASVAIVVVQVLSSILSGKSFSRVVELLGG